MASAYRIQVVEVASGNVVATWEPGGAVEQDLANELAGRVRAKGVGVGRTAKHVSGDVLAAFRELLYELKQRV